MNLLDLAVKITCDDQASGQVAGIGSKITGALGTAAKAGGAAVAALGTATIAVGKTALDAYANYEQLTGGIQTLFGAGGQTLEEYAASVGQSVDQASGEYQRLIQAQNMMMGNAANAFQTAGTSANKYMEVATSFAASLVNSVGGDTVKAAEMTDMAIQDMSDNANKMGTSLDTVQEAYMSLSRGNYEMLDSLKLGYGGTKSELERLLSDAEELSAAQGNVRDFSVDSYADIVEAIHLVQDEMGITGTTAKEASTTIEGSVNQAKAAWGNFLTALGDDSGDTDLYGVTEQLVSSVMTAGENILPRIGVIMEGIVLTATEYAPMIGQAIMGGLSQIDFAGIGQTASNLILMLVNGIVQNLPTLAMAALQIITALGQGLITNGPQIFSSLGQLLLQLANYIIQNVPNILNAAVQFFGMILQGIAQNAPMIIATLISLLGQLIVQVISWAAQMLGQAASAAAGFLGGLMGGLASLPGQVVSFLGGIISDVASWVGEMASNAIDAASKFASNLIDGLASIPGQVVDIGGQIIQGLVDGVVGAAGSLIDAVGDAINGAIGWAKSLLGIASPSKVFREFGRFSMQGMALGIDDDADRPVRSLEDAYSAVSAVPMRAPSVAAAAGTTYNVYLDGSLVTVDSRIGRALDAFVTEVVDEIRKR